MDFGMPFLLETDSIEECAKLCTTLNLQFVELNMNFPQCQLSALSVKKLNTIRRESRIYFTIHLDEQFDISNFNIVVRDAYLKTLLGTITLAQSIQAPIINMHLAKGVYITLPSGKEFLYHKFMNKYTTNLLAFREICEEAIGSSGIRIAIENTDGFSAYEQAAIQLLLESKCFGLTLDIGRSHSAHNIDIDFYTTHADRLIHMHAHDADSSSNHLALGDGEIDLSQHLLLAQNANSRVVLETNTIDSLTVSVSKLGTYLPRKPVNTGSRTTDLTKIY